MTANTVSAILRLPQQRFHPRQPLIIAMMRQHMRARRLGNPQTLLVVRQVVADLLPQIRMIAEGDQVLAHGKPLAHAGPVVHDLEGAKRGALKQAHIAAVAHEIAVNVDADLHRRQHLHHPLAQHAPAMKGAQRRRQLVDAPDAEVEIAQALQRRRALAVQFARRQRADEAHIAEVCMRHSGDRLRLVHVRVNADIGQALHLWRAQLPPLHTVIIIVDQHQVIDGGGRSLDCMGEDDWRNAADVDDLAVVGVFQASQRLWQYDAVVAGDPDEIRLEALGTR